MSTATQERPNGQATQTREQKPQTDFDRLMAKKAKIEKALDLRESAIEEGMPDFVKSQAKRFIARAKAYWARSADLQQCTEASFVKCVIEAAELGFAIDGKMVHAVKFNKKIKGTGGFEAVAQTIIDYKALIAVAKRHGLIQDCWARIVLPGELTIKEESGKVQYLFTPDLAASRDRAKDALGVLSVATHKDGWFRCDFMPMVDVLAIKARSRSGEFGPWVTDPGEMAKKTGIKRLLKTFSDDPGLLRAMDIDADSDEPDEEKTNAAETRNRINDLLSVKPKQFTPDTSDVDLGEDEPLFNPPNEAEIDDANQTESPFGPLTPEQWAESFIASVPAYEGKAKVKEEGQRLKASLFAVVDHLPPDLFDNCAAQFAKKHWSATFMTE